MKKALPIGRREALMGLVAVSAAAACHSKEGSPMSSPRLPTLYLPHGGGPCFFMDWTMGPKNTWDKMAAWLGGIDAAMPVRPKALLVISAHWEEPVVTVTEGASSSLLYDYYGFPKHTYELSWPAAGSPEVAARVRALLEKASVATAGDTSRGLDHGVFVPLKVAYPKADLPTVQLSLRAGLDPAEHLAIGRALAPLRDEGVFIVGSGMSYHNMRAFNSEPAKAHSERFDAWLAETAKLDQAARDARLTSWASAPSARESHPREEHLLPLMVVAGAAGADRGVRVFGDEVMGAQVSALQFG